MSRSGTAAAVIDERDEVSEPDVELSAEEEEELIRRVEEAKRGDLVPLDAVLAQLRRP